MNRHDDPMLNMKENFEDLGFDCTLADDELWVSSGIEILGWINREGESVVNNHNEAKSIDVGRVSHCFMRYNEGRFAKMVF